MATRKRTLAKEYRVVGDMIPYYESVGDTRSADIMRFHQSRILLEEARRQRRRQSVSQRDATDVYAGLASGFSENESLKGQIRSIRRAQQKVVLYASKTPEGVMPTAALFWTRQGRTDVQMELTWEGKTKLLFCVGGLILRNELSFMTEGWAESKPGVNRATLHSGTLAATRPTHGEPLFVADDREVELIVGAQDIEAWAENQQSHDTFGIIAARVADHISAYGITNAGPDKWTLPSTTPSWRE